MSILTKTFIVLQMVFSLALAVLVVMFASSQQNLKDRLSASQAGMIASSAAVAQTEAQKAQLLNKYNSLKDDGQRKLDTAQGHIDQLTTQNQEVQSRLDQATLASSSQQTNATLMTNTIATAQQQLTAKDNELKDLRPQAVKLTAQIGDLQRAYNTEKTRGDLAERTIRELKEALAQAEEKPPAPSSGPGASAGPGDNNTITANAAAGTAVTINGTIKSTKDINGKRYVSLSLGSRDGVHTGTRFTVYRNNAYVGDVVVQQVSPEDSLGVVTITKPGNQVSENDLVISGPNM